MIIYKFLENLACYARTEDEEIPADKILVNHNFFRTCFILYSHCQVKRRLRVRNQFPVTGNNRNISSIYIDNFNIRFVLPN